MLKINFTESGDALAAVPPKIRAAAGRAMRGVAFDVRDALRDGMRSAFDRPKPYTLNAFRITVQGGDNPAAVVWALPKQAEYLETQIEGGDRDSKPFEHRLRLFGGRVALPDRGAKLDSYGNMSRSFITRTLQDTNTSGKAKRFFVGTPKGGDRGEGVWARVSGNRRLVRVMRFAEDAQYSERFDMSAIAGQTVNARWESQLVKAMGRV